MQFAAVHESVAGRFCCRNRRTDGAVARALTKTEAFKQSCRDEPGIDRGLLASATIRLASTANSLPPTSPAEMHASTTRSKTRRKMSLSRNRSLRARENAEWSGILSSMLEPQNQR
jgi:hypothetical protein